MKKYYVNDNAQLDGYREVHNEDCGYIPLITSKTYLGIFSGCKPAIKAAEAYYSKVDGCKICSPACNTR